MSVFFALSVEVCGSLTIIHRLGETAEKKLQIEFEFRNLKYQQYIQITNAIRFFSYLN
jgi:hypothetical protein